MYEYLPVFVFWLSIVLMLGSVLYQILKLELSPSSVSLILLEIAVTCILLHLIYQVPYYGLYGTDIYGDLALTKSILTSGFVAGNPEYIIEPSYFAPYASFPIIHIWGSIVSLITNIDIFYISKWVPSFLGVPLIFLLYFLSMKIFKDQKISLLSALLFSYLQAYILFGSLFVRQTYGLVLALCCIYLYFSARHSLHPRINYSLSIMFLIGTAYAHHLTSLMLFLLILVHYVLIKMAKLSIFGRKILWGKIVGVKVSATFLLLTFIIPLAYWMHISTYTFNVFVTFGKSIFNFAEWGSYTYAETTGLSAIFTLPLRIQIMYFGYYLFIILFSIILLYWVLNKARKSHLEIYSYTLFFFLCGLIGVLSLYLVAPAAYPDRLLLYGLLFGFTPLIMAILKGKYTWFRRIGVFLLIAFMLFNIYTINPDAWDVKAEKDPMAVYKEDYTLAKTIDFSNGSIFGHPSVLMAILDVQNNLGTTVWDTRVSDVNISKFDWIIIDKTQLEIEKTTYPEPRTDIIAALDYLVTKGSPDYSKVYDSNRLLVFKHHQFLVTPVED